MTKQAKRIPRQTIIAIAAQTGSDPRTVERVAKGQPVKRPSLARILPALRALGLVLVALALGCDAEGYSVSAVEPDADVAVEPSEGPGRGGNSTVFAVPDVQAVTVSQDAGTAASPDTMPAVTLDALVLADSKVQVLADMIPAAPSMAVCKAPKVHMANVCTGYWNGTKTGCVQSGQDYTSAIYGAIVKVGEQPCTAYAVGTAPYYSADVIVIPAGGCDFYCPKPTN